jgi:U3 small nucleolar RNA-associated protein 14
MAGRKSDGIKSGGVSKRSKSRQNPRQRSQNALAIAASQVPERSKVRQSRLGRAEEENRSRKKAGSDEEEDDEDEDEGSRKRSRPQKGRFDELDIDEGSDSEGNKWKLGEVDSDDDSDIDSDEAFGESDEEKFEGYTFRASKKPNQKSGPSKHSRKANGDINLDESEEDESENFSNEDDSFGEDGIDLADMLDASESEEETAPNPKKRKSRPQEEHEEEDISTYSEGSDSEAESDTQSVLSLSEDDNEDQDEARLSSLQKLISSLPSASAGPAKRQRLNDSNESRAASEYGLSTSQKLTIEDLLPSITDPSLKRSLKLLTSDDQKPQSKKGALSGKLTVPLAKRQQDKLDRTAAYEKSKETLDRWIETVKHNRRADHLSFPLADPRQAHSNPKIPRNQNQPFNELERTIQGILEDSGLAAKDGEDDEKKLQAFEQLETKKMPLEEVEMRRAELRKARELLFREEVRAKRIKKIKSKSYRRVHRREREKAERQNQEMLEAAGFEIGEDEKEGNDRRRAAERMGAKHRESRWAKGMKESGRTTWDEDARSGVTEMARRNEELRRRMEGKSIRTGSDDSDLSDDSGDASGSEEDDDGFLLRQLEKAEKASAEEPKSKLASMKFMQNAETRRKAENDGAIRELKRDLAGSDASSEEDTEDFGRRKLGPKTEAERLLRNQPAEASRNELEDREASGNDDVASQVSDEEVDVKTFVDDRKESKRPLLSSKSSSKLIAKVQEAPEEIGNPWLLVAEKSSSRSRPSKTKKDNPTSGNMNHKLKKDKKALMVPQDREEDVIIDPTAALTLAKAPSKANGQYKSNDVKSNTENTSAPHNSNGWKAVTLKTGNGQTIDESSEDEFSNQPFASRDQELMRRAFAGDDVVADFEKEKADVIENEDEKIIDNTLPGWGAWTGDGISKREKAKNKGKVMQKVEGIRKDARKDRKLEKVIINEKRIKKVGFF